MKNIFLIITAALLISFTGYTQDTNMKQKIRPVHKNKKIHRRNYTKLNNPEAKNHAITDKQPPKVTDLHNSGSSNGTMASNNDPGKVTTSDKGKTGPKNGAVKKGKKK